MVEHGWANENENLPSIENSNSAQGRTLNDVNGKNPNNPRHIENVLL